MAKTCGFCGLIVDSSAEKCEKCGYQFASDSRANIAVTKDSNSGISVVKALMSVCALVMIVIWWNQDSGPVVVSRSSAQANADVTPAPRRAETAQSCLSLQSDWKFSSTEFGNSIIVGMVNNTCSKTFSYGQITFKLYDKAGAQVGTAMDNIGGLDGNGKWRFKAHVIDSSSVSTARFDKITAF